MKIVYNPKSVIRKEAKLSTEPKVIKEVVEPEKPKAKKAKRKNAKHKR